MGKNVAKIIAVSSTAHPLHKFVKKLCEAISEELKIPYEIRIEDYVFLTEYGDKDEYGFAFLPQIFVQYSNGSIRLVLSKIPINEKLKPDLEKAKNIILEKIA
ncbi:MAG: hypothetical protein DRO23_12060 [Thermoprotei archaeon]|nr:MAG: hypothetical protein DRO23_12060 [Thermoprotei archaeon]